MAASGLLQRVKDLLWPFSQEPEHSDQALAKMDAKVKGGTYEKRQNKAKSKHSASMRHSSDLHSKFQQAVFMDDSLHTRQLSVPESLVLQVVENNLKSADFRQKAVPRLPTVIPQLLKSLRDPDASAKQYVAIIEQDPVIASAVLKMSNSVYFNPGNNPIDSFQRAVVTLGIQGLRTLLSTAVMQPIIHCKSPYFQQFGKKLWDHSLCCAVGCQILAIERGADPFKAYLLGLTHDTGKITIFTQLAQQFKLNTGQEKPPAHAFVKLMDKIDLQLSYQIARDWGFPEDILQALKEQTTAGDQSNMSELGQILFLANQACEAYLLLKTGLFSEQEAAMLLEKLQLPGDLMENLDKLYRQAGEHNIQRLTDPDKQQA